MDELAEGDSHLSTQLQPNPLTTTYKTWRYERPTCYKGMEKNALTVWVEQDVRHSHFPTKLHQIST